MNSCLADFLYVEYGFLQNPPVEGTVDSIEQKTESFVNLMSTNSISGLAAFTNNCHILAELWTVLSAGGRECFCAPGFPVSNTPITTL
jgi:hypothetical protein